MKTKLNGPEKLVCNIHNEKIYVVYIRPLKQALNHGLILKKVHRMVQFNQEAQIKPNIKIKTKLGTGARNYFKKDFSKLMNNSGFGKTMENVRKHRYIKLVTTDKRTNQLVSEPNYYTTKQFSKGLFTIEMKKAKVKMDKPVIQDYQCQTLVKY